MPGVIATGRGKWTPADPDPYVVVPPGTIVYFFQEPLRLAAEEENSGLDRLGPDVFARPDIVAGPGQQVPNHTLTEPEQPGWIRVPAGHPRFVQVVAEKGDPLRLGDVLRRYEGCEIYWGACLVPEPLRRLPVDVGVLNTLAETNLQEFRTLEQLDVTTLLVDDKCAVIGWRAPAWLYEHMRASAHHCDGLLTVSPVRPGDNAPAEFVVTDLGEECGCRLVFESTMAALSDATGNELPVRYE